MDVFSILLILLIGGGSILSVIMILRKGRDTSGSRQWMNPAAQGPRMRDGVVSYNQFEGRRYNIEIEDMSGHSTRYQRRHSSGKHKQAKPWEK